MPKSYALVRKTLTLLSISILSGCANLSQVPPGAPFAEVQAQFGAPNFSCDHPDGTRRVIWTQQPMGQFAWGANVGTDGRIDQVTPTLTDKKLPAARHRDMDGGARPL